MINHSVSPERRQELLKAMEGQPDDQAVLFIVGWGPPEITCGEMRSLLKAQAANVEKPEGASDEGR